MAMFRLDPHSTPRTHRWFWKGYRRQLGIREMLEKGTEAVSLGRVKAVENERLGCRFVSAYVCVYLFMTAKPKHRLGQALFLHQTRFLALVLPNLN